MALSSRRPISCCSRSVARRRAGDQRPLEHGVRVVACRSGRWPGSIRAAPAGRHRRASRRARAAPRRRRRRAAGRSPCGAPPGSTSSSTARPTAGRRRRSRSSTSRRRRMARGCGSTASASASGRASPGPTSAAEGAPRRSTAGIVRLAQDAATMWPDQRRRRPGRRAPPRRRGQLRPPLRPGLARERAGQPVRAVEIPDQPSAARSRLTTMPAICPPLPGVRLDAGQVEQQVEVELPDGAWPTSSPATPAPARADRRDTRSTSSGLRAARPTARARSRPGRRSRRSRTSASAPRSATASSKPASAPSGTAARFVVRRARAAVRGATRPGPAPGRRAPAARWPRLRRRSSRRRTRAMVSSPMRSTTAGGELAASGSADWRCARSASTMSGVSRAPASAMVCSACSRSRPRRAGRRRRWPRTAGCSSARGPARLSPRRRWPAPCSKRSSSAADARRVSGISNSASSAALVERPRVALQAGGDDPVPLAPLPPARSRSTSA